jgi:hypothetical protein
MDGFSPVRVYTALADSYSYSAFLKGKPIAAGKATCA